MNLPLTNPTPIAGSFPDGESGAVTDVTASASFEPSSINSQKSDNLEQSRHSPAEIKENIDSSEAETEITESSNFFRIISLGQGQQPSPTRETASLPETIADPTAAIADNQIAALNATVSVSTTDDIVDGDTSSIGNLIADPGADGAISLREAVIAANNTPGDDVIQLQGGLTYRLTISGAGEDNSATGDLDIRNNGSITIETTTVGQQATIDAGGEMGLRDRVLQVVGGATLTLNDTIVTGGFTPELVLDDKGGGIYIGERNGTQGGNLTLNRSTVSGNITEGESGGGIFNNQGVVELNNSEVSNNQADNRGGGIYSTGGTLNLNQSSVTGNTTSTRSGGGIHNRFGDVTINNSSVSGNSSDTSGGGIYHTGEGWTVRIINNSSVNNNDATSGGGVRNGGGTVIVEDSTISGNTARSSDGGGIRNYYSSVTNPGILEIRRSTVSNNQANSNGGGIQNEGGTATIESTTIAGNTSGLGGGGINTEDSIVITGNLMVTDSTITNNVAEGGGFATAGGGGIESDDSNVTINGTTISDNQALSGIGGGLSFNGNFPVEIDNSEILNNVAFEDGGGISFQAEKLTLTNSIVRGNEAQGENGGGISIDASLFHNVSVEVFYSTVRDNSANFGAGIAVTGITAGDTELILSESLVTGNTASEDGGGLFGDNGTIVVTNSTLDDNQADHGGGAALRAKTDQDGPASYVQFINSTISNNQATDGNGGGIFNEKGSELTLVNSTVSGNGATRNGGGIFNGSSEFGFVASVFLAAETTAINSTITNNTVDTNSNGTGNGGGIYNAYNVYYGGPPYYLPSGQLNLRNTIIAGNFDTPNNGGPGDIHPDISAGMLAPITTSGNNLFGDTTGGSGFDVTDLLNVDPLIGPLADNGGPLIGSLADNAGPNRTHALLLNSPAIDAGHNTAVPGDVTLDQRQLAGFPRIVDGNGNNVATVDIGAFEFNPIGGTSSRDAIEGTDGDDIITGLRGSDVLTGNGGNDIFAFTSYRDRLDTITDFTQGEDLIDLSVIFDNPNYNFILGGINGPAGAEIQIDPSGTSGRLRTLVILEGVDVQDLTLADFIL